jgi:hypothetical protein
MTDLTEATRRAQEHATNLQQDINNASTRIEHIRLTQLALEAQRLVQLLETLSSREDYTENV